MTERGRVAGWCERHPAALAALVALPIAVVHGWWIWTHRRLGALDPDEAGYIATAMRYERLLLESPWEFVRAVGGTGFGPVVPLLSVPLLLVGPRDPRTVMLLQPLLMVAATFGIAAVARRVATPAAATMAGVVFAVSPTATTAAQSNWFGLGATVGLALAAWGALASDGFRTRTGWWFGVGVAAMVASRTMAAGFVPAAAVLALVVCRRERRSVVRLAQSVALGLALAGPWFVLQRASILGYLTSYGYGEEAALYGRGGPLSRLWFRTDRVAEAIGRPVVVTALVVALVGAGLVLARRRAPLAPAESGSVPVDAAPATGGRPTVALAGATLVGIAALVTTTNAGVWFEMPLLVFALPWGAWAVGHAPAVLRRAVVVPVVGMAVVQLPVSWWWLPPTTDGVPWLAANHLHSSQQEPGFAEYDLRFGTPRRGEEVGAAREWRSLSADIVDVVDRIAADGRVSSWVSGNSEMFNSNTLYLESELRGDGVPFIVADSTAPAADRARWLEPIDPDRRGGPAERVLVIAVHDFILFPPDREVRRFHREALAAGWRPIAEFDMPVGGTVWVLRHRSS